MQVSSTPSIALESCLNCAKAAQYQHQPCNAPNWVDDLAFEIDVMSEDLWSAYDDYQPILNQRVAMEIYRSDK